MSNRSALDSWTMSSKDYILDNTTLEEQLSFIKEQIREPFNSGSTNYFKKIKKYVTDADRLDGICRVILENISESYQNLEFDLGNSDIRLRDFTETVYKFFVKDIRKLTYVFFREFLYNNKNRKNIIAEYQNMKLPVYPKEQYGTKDNYILMVKLPDILDNISETELSFQEFISYLKKMLDVPGYINDMEEYIDRNMVHDCGIFDDIMSLFNSSDIVGQVINKLEMDMTKTIILPYMEKNNMIESRITFYDPDEDEDVSDDDDEADM